MDSAGVKRQMSLNTRNTGEWLQIQRNTFTNWVNEGLKSRGVVIEDLRTDLSDGVNLVTLVEALTRHRIPGSVSKPSNQYQKLQNITVALDTVSKDGVKIVNIDSSDISSCNLKLILALIWQLVLKYQIGLSSPQHKSWILRWLNAIIPDCKVSNFTTDWNDGVALHALLDFCKPGLSPNWRDLDRNNRLGNCGTGMKLAMQNFNIPLILRPEDLASPELDERSAITYLSYFTRVGGPGYDATLQRVSSRTLPKVVTNFTDVAVNTSNLLPLFMSWQVFYDIVTDWQDGEALTNLVSSAGGQLTGGPNVEDSPVQIIDRALKSGREVGVEPILSAEDISQESIEHLGMMAYTAQYLPYPNHRSYDTYERTTVSRVNTLENSSYSLTNGYIGTANHNGHLSPRTSMIEVNNNRESVHVSKPLKVKTTFSDDDVYSNYASTIASNPPTSPPVFHLVRKSSMHAPRVEVPSGDHLKVDIYSVGVIMESKMTGVFDPELFKVEAIAPTGRVIKITGDGHYAAQFTADEIGRWKVSMYYDGRFLDGCPIDVCDPSQVKVRDLQGGHVGKNNTFHVDCTRAGPGDLGVNIAHNGRAVTAHISPTTTPGYKKVTFMPYESGAYEINVHFNRAEVREGDIEFFNPDERQRKAVFYTRVEPHRDYIEVRASCDWEVDYITGWPFICHVTDSSDISVYGMEDGTVCAYSEMIADCTQVGDGRIDAEVTYNGQRYPCKVKKDKPSIYRVQLKPRGSGIYKIWINYEGRPVKGSPFIQEIAELEKPKVSGDGLYRGVPGKPAVFTVDPRGFPGQVSVAVTGPSKPVNSQLEAQPNNTVKATYYPTERGPHTVHVKMDGKDIDGSPYRPLVVDPVNVRISGGWRPLLDERGVIPLRVNKEKHLPFDVSEAGPGELTAEVQGPNGKIPVTVDARNDGKHSVIFTPREEGKHHIHVNWGGYPLSNSPYLGYATHEPELEEPPGVRLVHVPVQPVERYPSPRSSVYGSVVDGPHVSIRGSEPDIYPIAEVNHKPVEVTYQSQPAPVSRPVENNYHPEHPQTRVQVLPVRVEHSSEPRFIDHHTEPKFVERKPEPTYTDPIPEPRYIQPKYEEPTVQTTYVERKAEPKAPMQYLEPIIQPNIVQERPLEAAVQRNPSSPRGPQKVILSGRGLKEAEVNKPAQFTVNGTQADPGKPTAHLKGVTDEIPVQIDPVQPQVYRCTYVPKKPGAYLLYTNWNDKPLKGSPFKVNVQEAAKPQNVVATVDTRNGLLGRDVEMMIDPRTAGPGKLTVKCTDPKGDDVPCRLNENFDGTKSLKITPKVTGKHTVEILYNSSHIMGSPYAVDIKASQIKGKVSVWGPGIENGIIPHFQSTFYVDTTVAGSGDLRVRIMGPKGAFHVKMRKASQKDKLYQCFYDPVEPGIYTVHVQWSGQHVEGSPFTVLLATSPQELQQMQEEVQETSTILDDNSVIMGRRKIKNSSYRPSPVIDDRVFY